MAQIIIPDNLTDPLKVIAKAQNKTLGELVRWIVTPSIKAYLNRPAVKDFLTDMKKEAQSE